jgi:hypothetical protein
MWPAVRRSASLGSAPARPSRPSAGLQTGGSWPSRSKTGALWCGTQRPSGISTRCALPARCWRFACCHVTVTCAWCASLAPTRCCWTCTLATPARCFHSHPHRPRWPPLPPLAPPPLWSMQRLARLQRRSGRRNGRGGALGPRPRASTPPPWRFLRAGSSCTSARRKPPSVLYVCPPLRTPARGMALLGRRLPYLLLLPPHLLVLVKPLRPLPPSSAPTFRPWWFPPSLRLSSPALFCSAWAEHPVGRAEAPAPALAL